MGSRENGVGWTEGRQKWDREGRWKSGGRNGGNKAWVGRESLWNGEERERRRWK